MKHLVQILQDLFKDYQPLAHENSLQFVLDIEADLPDIQAKPQQIQCAIENLIENAIRYTPQGGQIILTASSDDSKVFISVKDNGIGIPADDRTAIFERFYRAENAQIHTNDGSGLGLAIVKQIVDYHQGGIIIDSEQGAGTTFTVTFPRSRA